MGVNIVLYESVESIGEKDLIWVPGLGYVPVVVKEKRVLSDEAVREIAKYTGGPVLREVYIMAPDKEYAELLKKAGFELKPLEADVPIMEAIYGSVVEGAWRVHRDVAVASYPPLGNYDDFRTKVFVLDSVSNKIGVIVHENVHYAIKRMNLTELNPVEEAVARFYEVLTEIGVEDPLPVKDLPQKLEDEKVVENLRFLIKELGHSTRDVSKNLSEAAQLFIKAVNLVEERMLCPRILLRVVSGKACIENRGHLFRVVNC